jgi:predicted phage-related endonuclease
MNEIENRIETTGRAILLGHFESGSPEWHAARAGIGGSDIGTICGINRWQTRQDLIESAVRGSKGIIEPNLPMRMGTAFEPAIRRLWAEDHPELEVVETGTWRSTVNPFWTANPDGIIKDREGNLSILEIKFSQARELPESWVYQVQWYCMVLGLGSATIVQCSGNKLLEHKIKPNIFMQLEMQDAATKYERELREQIGIQP